MGFSNIEKLLDQYITTESDGTVRLKGVRQPRFSDLMKLTALVKDLRAQRAAEESDLPLAGLSDEQLADALVESLCALDDTTFTTVLAKVHARRSTPAQPAPSPALHTTPSREEREPTEGEESTSVANDVQQCSPERTSPPRTPQKRKRPARKRKRQGAAAGKRAASRGSSVVSADRAERAGVGDSTLSPAKVEAESETDRE